MKAPAATQRTAVDIADDIIERALDQSALAKMMRAVFDECSLAIQPGADRDSEWPNQLFEGLVVVEKYRERDSLEIMELAYELRRHLDAAKGGAR